MGIVKRNPAADIIRILALFLVVSVHFFLNNGFYEKTVKGETMFVMTLMRSFFMICVPLFLTLSGYLLRKKQLEKKYYKRITGIIITYILAGILCLFYAVVFLNEDYTIRNMVLSFLNFKAAPYAWYIEMYLGLFLLIPFLNIVYNSLPSQKWKIWLIITFIILTSLPAVTNAYDLTSFDWLSLPSSTTTMNKVLPYWWKNLYPITYYYIGCYLSEYGLKINKVLNFVLIIFWTVLSGSYCFWRSYKVEFIRTDWCMYHSLFNIVLTVLVFTFIINMNYDKFPQKLSWVLGKISGITLGGYLVSWIFDQQLYPILLEKVPDVTDQLPYYFIIVPAVFVLSLIASYVLSKIQFIIEKIFSLFGKLFKRKSKKTS